MAAAKQLLCLVTGGASGLGKATVKRLVQKHAAKAVIVDLPTSSGSKVAEEIGKDCYFHPADVSKLLIYTLIAHYMYSTCTRCRLKYPVRFIFVPV